MNIIKNNEGLFLWPDFNFNGLGNLEPGEGYQIRVKDSSLGFDNCRFQEQGDIDLRPLIDGGPR